MAIDTSLFVADIPAGTYTTGDVLDLGILAGPANVRSGRGSAILKQVTVGSMASIAPYWRIHVKNSNWIDDVESFAGASVQPTSFATESGNVQSGANCNLTPNSTWHVYAECVSGATSSSANSLFCLIDIDYPEVSSITDPRALTGFPVTIKQDLSVTTNAFGTAANAKWDVFNVDYFKAGAEYCLNAVELFSVTNLVAFIAFSGAAGMGGLTRIIPVNANIYGIRPAITYASKLVKGPMDVKVLTFYSSAVATDISMAHDYIKRGAA